MLKSQRIKTVVLLIAGFIVTASFFACEKKQGEPAYLGFNYFGLNPGLWVVYDVDSTVYDDFLGEIFHYQYQVKEINAGFFQDSQGDTIMRLERFYRQGPESSWEIKNVWTAKVLSHRAIKTEENKSFIKLAFPVKRNHSWNGNSLNSLPAQNYVFTDVHMPAEYGNMPFDSTVRVLQKDFETLIGLDLQYEVYATNVGMIHRKFIDINKEIDGTIVRGVDYTYTIVSFGNDENGK